MSNQRRHLVDGSMEKIVCLREHFLQFPTERRKPKPFARNAPPKAGPTRGSPHDQQDPSSKWAGHASYCAPR